MGIVNERRIVSVDYKLTGHYRLITRVAAWQPY
jgi:hypothetical protein